MRQSTGRSEIERFHCQLVSWKDIELWSKDVAKKVEDYAPDVIIGLTRGGWVPARILCDFLVEKNLCSIKTEHWGITAKKDSKARLAQGLNVNVRGKKVLLMDDITDTGMSMELALSHVAGKMPGAMKSATLLHIEGARIEPDYYSVFVPKEKWTWFVFPWNLNEDLCTLIPKTLYEPKELSSISASLFDQFDIKPRKDRVKMALRSLESKGRINHNEGLFSLSCSPD
jgi:hypoxanthine phosphoribosyltransferase